MQLRPILAHRVSFLAAAVGMTLAAAVVADEPPTPAASSQVTELGEIEWLRGFDRAASVAREKDKPLLVLFQEVPGCATCKNYGNQVLSHPLIVESAETLFVPVAVYNNIEGDDRRVLKSFSEPTWNNPVVRIMTAQRQPLTSRLADDYSVAGLADAMVRALGAAGGEAPAYLTILAEEQHSRRSKLERATLSMHCFWEGEVALAQIRGVVETAPGFIDGQEIVELQFDPLRISYTQLIEKAKAAHCASTVFARSDSQEAAAKLLVGSNVVRSDQPYRPDAEPKYYLSRTALKYLPMTSVQSGLVNAALGSQKPYKQFLSGRQQELLQIIQNHPDAGWTAALGEDIVASWYKAQAIAQQHSGR